MKLVRADHCQKSLDLIKKSKRVKALAVVINSPGGSPVQSLIICDKLRYFCQERKIPLYTFAEDLAASGGYFFLCIGDKTYAQRPSIVGSIGVIYMRFAFNKFLQNRGIEPRIISSNQSYIPISSPHLALL